MRIPTCLLQTINNGDGGGHSIGIEQIWHRVVLGLVMLNEVGVNRIVRQRVVVSCEACHSRKACKQGLDGINGWNTCDNCDALLLQLHVLNRFPRAWCTRPCDK